MATRDSLDPIRVATALDDAARLAAVERFAALPLPVREIEAELKRLADELGGQPLTAATYLDGALQHFIATNDGPMDDLYRETTHCQYVIATGAWLCVQDAGSPTSRFSKLARSLVRGRPLAAYLGFPLDFEGQTVGAVCAIDTDPREWTQAQHFAVYQSSQTVRRMVEAVALEPASV